MRGCTSKAVKEQRVFLTTKYTSVSHLETGDIIAFKWEPELHELPSKAFQAQLLHQV
jgi:hypothetical protein